MAATTDRKAYHREWYLKNREKRIAQTREYQEAHVEECKAWNAKWQKSNPDKVKEAAKRYRAKNTDKCRKRCREWHKKNYHVIKDAKSEYKKKLYALKKDEILSKGAEWREKNKEKLRASQKAYRERPEVAARRKERMRQWTAEKRKDPEFVERHRQMGREFYASNKDKISKKHREYREKNRGHLRHLLQKRRALEASATVNLAGIKEWFKQVRSAKTAICYYCQNRVSTRKIHFDHIVALSKGGQHSIENLCVSCQSCNQRKHVKSVQAFVKVGQQLLAL